MVIFSHIDKNQYKVTKEKVKESPKEETKKEKTKDKKSLVEETEEKNK